MLRHKCPYCKKYDMVWDARAMAFLCLSYTCPGFVEPHVDGLERRDLCTKISRGQIAVDPAWFHVKH